MEIKWYGQSCFEVKGKEKTLIFDPFSEDIGLQLPKNLIANVVLVTHEHHDHNNVGAVSGRDGTKPKVITAPGEYEVAGVYIQGIPSFHDKNRETPNTIYVADIEGIKICHLGDLGLVLENGELEKIGDVDVLFVPIGGVFTINAREAVSVINQIEPKIVIPMHYKIPGLNVDLEGLENFAREENIANLEGKDVLKISKTDLPVEERKIVILKAQSK